MTVQVVHITCSSIFFRVSVRKLVGISCLATIAMLNLLIAFYFIGSNVASYPTQAQRALADGHEICIRKLAVVKFSYDSMAKSLVDSWSHPYMTTLSSEDAFAEMWYSVARQIIKIALGVSPTCWRPPFGDVDDRIRAIANALELRCDMWDYDSGDASVNGQSITEETVENNYNSFLQTASSGAFNLTGTILLMHELNNFTMSEAMKYYTRISSAFRYIVPIGVSLNKTQPYLEPNYSMPTFEQYASGTLTVNPSTSHTTSSTTPDDSPTSGQSAASANSARGVAMEFLSAQVLLAVLAVLFTSQRST
ncbi:hypothetical protein D9757_002064 [Collybiopsis confluens]|uniref:chitin deacetylase n=1 Tax=Collybiopsis confluens TaxID=2823264 RepID=A0A8H5MEC5_9AGAR|nr:hypothetical protein D9757_002064 [Collybiopsis confluens]